MLAGIPKSPNNYSPILNYDKAKERQYIVLKSMVNNKYITESEMEEAYNEELTFYGYIDNNNLSTIRYFQDAVMDELDSLHLPNSFISTGNIKIYTTLDLNTQTIMDKAIKNNKIIV